MLVGKPKKQIQKIIDSDNLASYARQIDKEMSFLLTDSYEAKMHSKQGLPIAVIDNQI